ncbi:MAG: T9SS type A sorting domain-containing protein [Saprospiraceae bacterium]|nr:T9SS type A sorting domain-containing protein [Saprospiraceae bacterium]
MQIGQNVTFTGTIPPNALIDGWYMNGVGVATTPIYTTTFSSSGVFKVCFRARDANACPNEICKDLIVVSSVACQNNQLPICELVLNGKFYQHNPAKEYPYSPGNNGQFLDYSADGGLLNNTEILCNWMNNGGTPTIYKLTNNKPSVNMAANDFVVNDSNADILITQNELDLINGEIYKLSYEIRPWSYFIFDGTVAEFEVGLSNKPLSFHANQIPINKRILSLEKIDNMFGNTTLDDINYIEYNNMTFTYNSDIGKNLYFKVNNIDGLGFINVKNISITKCCVPDPQISYTTTGCKYNFSFTNTGDPALLSYEIESGPAGTGSSASHIFSIPGTYTVCLYAMCEGRTVEECVDITVTGPCFGCSDGITIVSNTTKCGPNDQYVANVSIGLDPGTVLCRNDFVHIEDGQGNVVSSYNVTFVPESISNNPEILLSLFFDTEPSGCYRAVLCNPNPGAYACFTFCISSTQACDQCIDLNLTATAICTDLNPNDNVLQYSGSFQITPPLGALPCGTTSDIAGYSQGTMAQNNGTYTVPFNITTNTPGPINSEVTICFTAGGLKYCYKVKIQVSNPCPLECFPISISTPLKCTDLKSGSADFSFEHILFIKDKFKNDFELCDIGGVEILGGSNVTMNHDNPTISGNGYYTDISFSVPCEDVNGRGTIEITMNFCNNKGETFCVTYALNLECDDCPTLNGRNAVDLKIYELSPNPTSHILNISSKSKAEHQIVYMYDMVGNLMVSQSLKNGQNQISVEQLNEGLYRVQVLEDFEKHNFKIIVVK